MNGYGAAAVRFKNAAGNDFTGFPSESDDNDTNGTFDARFSSARQPDGFTNGFELREALTSPGLNRAGEVPPNRAPVARGDTAATFVNQTQTIAAASLLRTIPIRTAMRSPW